MRNYTKIDHSMIHSSVWKRDAETNSVWASMLTMADQDGEVYASIPGLAQIAMVTTEKCIDVLGFLMGPDEFSRTKDHDGRRIEEIDGGWRLLNFKKYRGESGEERAKRKAREATRRWREKKNITVMEKPSRTITHHHGDGNKTKQNITDPDLPTSLRSVDPLVSSSSKKGRDTEDPIPLLASSLTPVDPPKKKKTRRKSPVREKTANTPGSQVWKSYCIGFEQRYGIEPRSNAKNYRHCQDLIKRVGFDEAVALAQYYPTYRNGYHVSRGHPLESLLKDCETIYTAMMTNKQITNHGAREQDRLKKELDDWSEIIEKYADKE